MSEVKVEQVEEEAGASKAVASKETAPVPDRATTKTLVRDGELETLLRSFLGASETLGGLKDLLSLSDIKAVVENKTKGEKPLLVSDFLWSNINVSYIDTIEEETISKSTKLVREGKTKKPAVQDYTPDLWAGANFLIIRHLINVGTTNKKLLQYVTYSSMIADYLALYNNPGVLNVRL